MNNDKAFTSGNLEIGRKLDFRRIRFINNPTDFGVENRPLDTFLLPGGFAFTSYPSVTTAFINFIY
jgi:hypothetical protein